VLAVRLHTRAAPRHLLTYHFSVRRLPAARVA